jgi:hypothetical protein
MVGKPAALASGWANEAQDRAIVVQLGNPSDQLRWHIRTSMTVRSERGASRVEDSRDYGVDN